MDRALRARWVLPWRQLSLPSRDGARDPPEIMHDRTTIAERSVGMSELNIKRRFPIGAELIGEGRGHFRIWAPKAKTARGRARIEGSRLRELESASRRRRLLFRHGRGGSRNALSFPAKRAKAFSIPIPASRYQPDGPHRSSCVVDPTRFRWTDQDWRGSKLAGQIMYEMHIGTFTPEGTWRGRRRETSLADGRWHHARSR